MVPEVVLLDDSIDMRTMMGKLIESKLHIACLSVGSVREFLMHDEEVLQSRLAILDVNLGDEEAGSGLDAYDWLQEHDFKGRIYFFTGHARAHPLVNDAVEHGAGLWEKPIDASELIMRIREVIGNTPETTTTAGEHETSRNPTKH
ncbi:MAG TPA: response regulator [Bdellovibrionales bacterium]|jgi:FixJ family two-component response regulator|nr:response regulator [Bdellovibrionales bacterium]